MNKTHLFIFNEFDSAEHLGHILSDDSLVNIQKEAAIYLSQRSVFPIFASNLNDYQFITLAGKVVGTLMRDEDKGYFNCQDKLIEF